MLPKSILRGILKNVLLITIQKTWENDQHKRPCLSLEIGPKTKEVGKILRTNQVTKKYIPESSKGLKFEPLNHQKRAKYLMTLCSF